MSWSVVSGQVRSGDLVSNVNTLCINVNNYFKIVDITLRTKLPNQTRLPRARSLVTQNYYIYAYYINIYIYMLLRILTPAYIECLCPISGMLRWRGKIFKFELKNIAKGLNQK